MARSTRSSRLVAGAAATQPTLFSVSDADKHSTALEILATPRTRHRFFVVSYDVGDDKRRNKIAKTLLGFGERVQKSVFECLLNETQYADLQKRLERHIDLQHDSIRYYNLGGVQQADVTVRGLGTVTELPTVYIA